MDLLFCLMKEEPGVLDLKRDLLPDVGQDVRRLVFPAKASSRINYCKICFGEMV